MKRFAVEVTDAAMAKIRDHARYVALEQFDPTSAQRWLYKAWKALDTLDAMQRAHAITEGNEDAEPPVNR